MYTEKMMRMKKCSKMLVFGLLLDENLKTIISIINNESPIFSKTWVKQIAYSNNNANTNKK